ncbi:hypothetical protein AB0K02_25850 [Streptomyces sp. NPDC049597]|uniref:hypothetical protein n=1 Tax=Streptomyces sp. NPDC049597 TaxID=3155276 RepID=UPI0034160C77
MRRDGKFSNGPVLNGSSAARSHGATQIVTPARAPVGAGTGESCPRARVAVLGDRQAGPQRDAPLPAGGPGEQRDKKGDSPARADSAGADGAGWSGVAIAAAAGGGAVLVAAVAVALLRRRATAATGPSGGPSPAAGSSDSSTTGRNA